MADAKISALTAASTPLAGTEVLPIVQSGTTKKVAVSSLTAGRAVSTGVLTVVNGANPYIEMPDGTGTTYIQVATGDLNFVPRSGKNVSISNSNLVIGTAGKGIDFSANTHAAGMTSELLNDYEEGTWTPSLGGNATYSTQLARYVKIGKQVTVSFVLQVNAIGTGSTTTISGLPYAVGSSNQYHNAGSLAYFDTLNVLVTSIVPRAVWTTSTVDFTVVTVAASASTTTAAIFRDGAYVIGNITYLVD